MSLANKLVSDVNCTRVFDGQSSVEKLITDLSVAKSYPDGKILVDAHGFVSSEELAISFLKNDDAYTMLIPLYDNHKDVWTRSLKGSGTETLKNFYLVLLGALNEAHFGDKMKSKEMFGGFLGRTIIVNEEQGGKPNSLIFQLKNKFNYKDLVPGLKEIANLSGQMHCDEETALYYDSWYQKFAGNRHNDKTGFANRVQVHVLKVAMLLALADLSLTITMPHMLEAMEKVFPRMNALAQIAPGEGKSKHAASMKQLIKILYVQPDRRMKRSELMAEYYQDFDVSNLPEIVQTLVEAKYIVEEASGEGISYKLNPERIAMYSKLVGDA